jgi:hypothetical protein
MKYLSQITFVFLIAVTFACGGGGSNEKEQTSTSESKEKTEETTTSNSNDAEEKLCYYTNAGMFVSLSLIIKGNTVTGSTARGSTPSRIEEFGNIKEGTKQGNKLILTFVLVNTRTGKGIGETYQEVWVMKENQLVQELKEGEEMRYSISEPLEKETCNESTRFSYETPKAEAPKSYEYDGVMNGKLKIKMFLTIKPNPEDKSITLFEGYYYYLSQGKDKKIALKGQRSIHSPMALVLNEVEGEKTFGKFMIEGFEFSEELTCTWLSADDKKQMQTVLTPVK